MAIASPINKNRDKVAAGGARSYIMMQRQKASGASQPSRTTASMPSAAGTGLGPSFQPTLTKLAVDKPAQPVQPFLQPIKLRASRAVSSRDLPHPHSRRIHQ
eukprot:316258-Pleurochrysis_carterae.AAC.6